MNEFLLGLEIPVAELTATLPEMPALPSMPQLPELAMLAAGLPALNASMQMDLALSMDLTLPSVGELANLEAMAQLSGAFGIAPFSIDGQAQLDLAAGSINVNAPALQELAAILPPALPAFEGLGLAAGLVGSVSAVFNVNLLLPDVMPQLSIALGEMAAGLPSMETAMSASFAADLGIAARLINASAALGIDLTDPGGAAELSAALELAANIEAPSLSLTAPAWGNLIGLMSSVDAANAAFGIPLLLPGSAMEMSMSMDALEAGLGQLEANLGMPIELPEMESGELSAAAELGMQLAAAVPSAGMDFSGIPSFSLGGLPLGGLPEMGDMSLAATFAASFESATGVALLSGIPCPNLFCIA
ncbi:MAG: hypothetical protein CMM01_24080 [Rhodopirellula sp.]|nr:hypothetical protein [Rhodopirellula sp.]